MSGEPTYIERHPVDEAQLDAAIDTVAREMTEFEPSGALRAQVLERIGQGRRRSSPAVPRWAWAGAAAAVVLAVATAVWIVRPMRTQEIARSAVAEQRSGGPSPAAAGPERPAGQSAPMSAKAAAPAGVSVSAARTSRAAVVPGSGTADSSALEDAHPVPALAEIEPLTFSAVEPDPLQIAAMEVAPLRAMPSIDIPSLGPGSNDIQSADPKKEK
jgi:hypothetical protein